MEYVQSKEDPLIKILRTPQHHTNSTLLQTVKNLKNSKLTKKIKNTIAQNTKETWERKKTHGGFPHSLDENLMA